MAIRNDAGGKAAVRNNPAPTAAVLLLPLAMLGFATPVFGVDAQTTVASPLTTAWARHTITAISVGADGVDLHDINADGLLDVVTPWEEGRKVTVSLHPPADADPREPWPTSVVASGLLCPEDAKFADLDGDGAVDVITATDVGARLYVHFAGETWTTVEITASLGHNRWMQVSSADVDGDGNLDIVGGSRVGTAINPAVIAWFRNPGPERVRSGEAWEYHLMTEAGWAMSVQTLDVDGDGDPDTVVSDRAAFRHPDNSVSWSLYGARWIETVRGAAAELPTFVNHQVTAAGQCSSCAHGDQMFLALHDLDGDGVLDLLDGTSSSSRPDRIAVHRNLSFWGPPSTWSFELIPPSSDVGHYQGMAIGDIDGDGLVDLVISTWESNKLPPSPLTGVYWLRNLGNGTWAQAGLSGPEGTKYDNPALSDVDGDGDLDVLVTEQVENQGLVWFENPGLR